MVGPRQYLDAKGQRFFLGISACPVSDNSAIDRENRRTAELFAGKTAVLSLKADGEAYQTAKSLAQETNSGLDAKASQVKVARSLAEQITVQLTDFQVQGCGSIIKKVVVHPLTGRKIYVVVQGISSDSAIAATAIEREIMSTAVQINKDQAFRKGRSTAYGEAESNSRNDPASKRAGYEQGKRDITPLNGKPPKSAGKTQKTAKGDPAKSGPGPAKSGSVIGGDTEDDF